MHRTEKKKSPENSQLHKAAENAVQQSPERSRFSMTAALSLLTALAASASVTLHLMGETAHRTYLQSWGLDTGLFPKPVDWLLINGYSTAFDRGAAMLKLMSANILWSVVGFVALSLYLTILSSDVPSRSEKSPVWPEDVYPRLRRFAGRAGQTLLLVCALFFFLGASLVLMAVPIALGSAAGKSAMEREEGEYAKGCGKAAYSCVQIKKGSDIVGQGFVLDSSTAQIAIFDVDKKQARAISREGTETIVISVAKR